MLDTDQLRRRITLALASLSFLSSPLLQGCAPTPALADEPRPVEQPVAEELPPVEPVLPVQITPPASASSGGVVFWCGDRASLSAAVPDPTPLLSCPDLDGAQVVGQSEGRVQPPAPFRERKVSLDVAMTTHMRETQGVDACCYMVKDTGEEPPQVIMGRPLRDGEATLLADAVAGEAWGGRVQTAPDLAGLDAAQRQALAAGWLEDARAEHGSVAAFARLTLDLQALGAPPELVADALQAGLDEVRHAQRCFALASAFAGAPLSAGRLPMPAPREVDFATLVRETFVEACVGEAASVLCAMRARARCLDPAACDALERIVDDETRHAAFAWRVVAWGLTAGGQPARAALLEAAAAEHARLRALEDVLPPRSADSAADPALAAFGRVEDRARLRAQVDTWRGVVLPSLTALLGVGVEERLTAAARA